VGKAQRKIAAAHGPLYDVPGAKGSRMRANCVLTVVSGLLLAQCASKSSDLKAVAVTPVQYQSYTCPQLGREAEVLSAKAAELSAAQDKRWTRVSVPFVGSDAQETATRLRLIKGELEAIERVRSQKSCG
jgi:hypothetical protein